MRTFTSTKGASSGGNAKRMSLASVFVFLLLASGTRAQMPGMGMGMPGMMGGGMPGMMGGGMPGMMQPMAGMGGKWPREIEGVV